MVTASSKTTAEKNTIVKSANSFKMEIESYSARKNTHKVEKGSKLTSILYVEVTVTVFILIILRTGSRTLSMR